jgi:hypothetical protein
LIAFRPRVGNHLWIRIKTVFLIVQFAREEMAHAEVGMQFALAAELLCPITIA